MKKEQIIILLISFFLGMLILNMVKNVCGCELKEGFNSYVGGKSPSVIANNALTCGAKIASRCGYRIDAPEEYECAKGETFFVPLSDDPNTRCNRDLEYIQNKFGSDGLTACQEYDLNSWITEVCGPQFVSEPAQGGEGEGVVTGNACTPNPCNNNGSCSVNAGGEGYTCQCVDGFEGVNCETNIDDCANNPCQNGGTCNDGVNGYTCECVDSYSGTNCETALPRCRSGAMYLAPTVVDINNICIGQQTLEYQGHQSGRTSFNCDYQYGNYIRAEDVQKFYCCDLDTNTTQECTTRRAR